MIALAAGALAALIGAIVVLRRRFITVCVEGPSMEPTLRDGDRVLVRRARLDRVRRGQIVVVAGPVRPGRPPWLVKRSFAIPGDRAPGPHPGRVPPDALFVLGDNLDRSYDSRHAGYFGAGALLGVVVRKLEVENVRGGENPVAE